MATRYVLTPGSARLPSGNYAVYEEVNGRPALKFDAATDWTAEWTVKAPQGLSGALTAIIGFFLATATAGSVRWQVEVEAVGDGDALDLDAAESFDAANSAGTTAPATAGYYKQVSVALTNADGVAAGDYLRLRVRRDADGTSGTDDAAGFAYLTEVEIRDAA
jgi:hypothetical protein